MVAERDAAGDKASDAAPVRDAAPVGSVRVTETDCDARPVAIVRERVTEAEVERERWTVANVLLGETVGVQLETLLKTMEPAPPLAFAAPPFAALAPEDPTTITARYAGFTQLEPPPPPPPVVPAFEPAPPPPPK